MQAEQLSLVIASARILTSKIRMPDGIEHFVEVVSAELNRFPTNLPPISNKQRLASIDWTRSRTTP